MASIQDGPGRGRYLISSTDGAQLARFMADASAHPDLKLQHTIGPTGAPHTAVYDMAHATAAQLARRFAAGGELTIEPDRPLSLFGPQP